MPTTHLAVAKFSIYFSCIKTLHIPKIDARRNAKNE